MLRKYVDSKIFGLINVKKRPASKICFLSQMTDILLDDTVPVLARLAGKFLCASVKNNVMLYIQRNAADKSNMTLLKWFVGICLHNMGEETENICLSGAACLPLSTLENFHHQLAPEHLIRYR